MTEGTELAAGSIHHGPFFIAFAGLCVVLGLVQAMRPQLLWKATRQTKRGFVNDPDAAEPSHLGYAVKRLCGLVLAVGMAYLLFFTGH